MRTERRKLRWLVVAATIALATVACTSSAPDADEPAAEPTVGGAAVDAQAEEIATGFVEAFGGFDTERAITYLAEDAAILELIASVGAHRGVVGTLDELRLLISLLEAEGYRQILDPCEAQGASASGTRVHCTFDFHLFGSDQIGLGPYGGSSFDLTVRDGEIVRASLSFDVDEFSPQMWEPFATWVSEAYPEDAAVMYEDETYSGIRLAEESVRLWRRHVREYVEEVGL